MEEGEHGPYDTSLVHYGNGDHVLYMEQVIPTPTEIGLLLGEWLYLLRSALDSCVYDVAIHDNGNADPPPTPNALEFPLCASEEVWKRSQHRIKPLNEKHRDWVHSVQPYRSARSPESTLLYWLNELARIDRHRTLHVMGSVVAEANPLVWAPDSTSILFEDRSDLPMPLVGRTELARFTVVPYNDGDQVTADPNCGIDPQIMEWATRNPDPEVWRQLNLGDRLFHIRQFVAAIVGRFERDCLGSTRFPYLNPEPPADHSIVAGDAANSDGSAP